MIMPTLTGKTALVTGASRGIGRAGALALAVAGAQVLVHYGRGAKEAEDVVAEIRKAGGRADAIATDLAAADGAGKLAKQVRSIGSVIAFLASEDARWITGDTIRVDGGLKL
jgi:3-oxoacyl-[acyl-carrier protein] reductase